MDEQHHRELDALAFQHGVPAAIGRFAPTTRHRVVRAKRRTTGGSRPTWPGITFVVLGLLALTLALAPHPAAAATGLVARTPLDDLATVATGNAHSCAVTTNHQARCWGRNGVGELGLGEPSTTEVAHPVRNGAGTGPMTRVAAVVAGAEHSCALLTTGQVRCWGANFAGQLGDATTDRRLLPVPVRATTGTGRLQDVVQITATADTTCALLANHQVRCWGGNGFGQTGTGVPETYVTRPTAVRAVGGTGPLTGATQIDLGDFHGCARLASGEARCWGRNSEGQLGDGSTDVRARPVAVRNAAGTGPLTGVRRISAGGHHTCATVANGTARCWGTGTQGQLGNGAYGPHPLPVRVVTDAARQTVLTGVATVDAGWAHSCARLTNGQVRCWGENDVDQLGNGVDPGPDLAVAVPVRNRRNTGNLVGIAQLATTGRHTCVRLADHEARCWGYGAYGGLGDGGFVNKPLPQIVVHEEEA